VKTQAAKARVKEPEPKEHPEKAQTGKYEPAKSDATKEPAANLQP